MGPHPPAGSVDHPGRPDRAAGGCRGAGRAALCVWREAGHAGGAESAAEHRRRFPLPETDPETDRGARCAAAFATLRQGVSMPTPNVFWFLPTHGDSRYLGTSRGARTVDGDYLRQVAVAADTLGYDGVLLPTGR